MPDPSTSPARKVPSLVSPVVWHAIRAARDAALAAGASSTDAAEAARQLALAAFPALPRPHLREALSALAAATSVPVGTGHLGHGVGHPDAPAHAPP